MPDFTISGLRPPPSDLRLLTHPIHRFTVYPPHRFTASPAFALRPRPLASISPPVLRAMPASEKLASLRLLLAERFAAAPRPPARACRTGLPAIDDLAGGLPLGAITEIVCAAPSCGGHLLLDQFLTTTRLTRTRVALIDGTDSFDPSSFDPDLLAHLVWVRCASTPAALQAADLLVRDANLGLVVLDLRRAPDADLRRIPSTHWYRLQRAVEPADLALVIETPRAGVPCAHLRFELTTQHAVDALATERPALAARLTPALHRQRQRATG